MRRRRFAVLGALLAAWTFAGTALAHATLVFGMVTVTPDPPLPGAPFEVTLTLEDPSLAPVEDAIVFIEIRPMPEDGFALPASSTEAPDLPPPASSLRLVETEPAVYRSRAEVATAGSYHLLVRDQTFQWEEANASVLLNVGAAPVGRLPFILPPTQVAPRSLWTWLLWLIGLPLVAGAVVTVLVLTSGKRSPQAEPGEA